MKVLNMSSFLFHPVNRLWHTMKVSNVHLSTPSFIMCTQQYGQETLHATVFSQPPLIVSVSHFAFTVSLHNMMWERRCLMWLQTPLIPRLLPAFQCCMRKVRESGKTYHMSDIANGCLIKSNQFHQLCHSCNISSLVFLVQH